MSKGHRAKISFEMSCQKHGTKEAGRKGKTLYGDPANHDRGLKKTGCPVCKAEENQQ